MKKYFILLMLFGIISAPVLALAAPFTPIVPPCAEYPILDSAGNPTAKTECQWRFNEFIDLINNLIKYALFVLAMPIAAIMFAYAGIRMVLSGGDTEARSTAKNVFTNTAFGLIIAVAAYLIISLVLSVLSPGNWTWIGFK